MWCSIPDSQHSSRRTGRKKRVLGHSRLHRDFQVSLGYISPHFKTRKIEKHAHGKACSFYTATLERGLARTQSTSRTLRTFTQWSYPPKRSPDYSLSYSLNVTLRSDPLFLACASQSRTQRPQPCLLLSSTNEHTQPWASQSLTLSSTGQSVNLPPPVLCSHFQNRFPRCLGHLTGLNPLKHLRRGHY